MSAVDLLVVGGTGLLGSALVERADGRGLEWAATFHSTPRSGDRWHRADLPSIRPLLDELRPAAIVNAAYVNRDPGLDAITRDAPIGVAEWTAAHGARFVQLSTDIVFDGELGRPYTETDRTNPVNDYGRAKAAMEAGVAAADPEAVLVRTSLLWGGPGDGGPQVRLVQNPDVSFFTDEFRNPLDVSSPRRRLPRARRSALRSWASLHVAGPRPSRSTDPRPGAGAPRRRRPRLAAQSGTGAVDARSPRRRLPRLVAGRVAPHHHVAGLARCLVSSRREAPSPRADQAASRRD